MPHCRARPGALALAAVTVLATLAGCTGGGPPSAGPSGSGAAAADGARTVAAPAYQAQHAGGTLRLLARSSAGTLDPQLNYTLQYWQLFPSVFDGLTAFAKVGGAASATVVPNLAEALPEPADGGRSYTFTLRRGIRFSDGREVGPDDVVASFRRLFRVSGPAAAQYFRGLVGADACLRLPAGCTLDGVTADRAARTVTLRLTAPDTELFAKLALPPASVLPADTPAADAGRAPVPGTGPYAFGPYDPAKSLLLQRNRYFREWSREARPQGYPDVIRMDFGSTPDDAVDAVLQGDADWMFDPPTATRLAELQAKDAGRLRSNLLGALWYLPMNVNVPPFDRVQARQAVSWAVDRAELVRLYGGDLLAQPACTVLPPGVPGHRETCDYTSPAGAAWRGPDLARARQLVQESGTAGQRVTVVTTDDDTDRRIGRAVAATLTRIGWRASTKAVPAERFPALVRNSRNRVQISLTSWYQDYPTASDHLGVLLSCAAFTPGSDTSANISGYCDQPTEANLARAFELAQTDPAAAEELWSRIDRQVMRNAPIAPLFTPKQLDVLSARTGNHVFSRQHGMLVDQLWVR